MGWYNEGAGLAVDCPGSSNVVSELVRSSHKKAVNYLVLEQRAEEALI